MRVLEALVERRAGSSPVFRTIFFIKVFCAEVSELAYEPVLETGGSKIPCRGRTCLRYHFFGEHRDVVLQLVLKTRGDLRVWGSTPLLSAIINLVLD